MEPTDASLIARIRSGDVAAWGEAFRTYYEPMYRTATRVLRGEDRSLHGTSAGDLVGEAMRKLIEAGVPAEQSSLKALMLRAVTNCGIDIRRRAV